MKFTVGMGSITDYTQLAKAGADELFCGYVPVTWNERFGNILPLNRREVHFYHVQIGTLEDMKILANMREKLGIPVTVAFNSLYYTKEQLPVLEAIFQDLISVGFQDVILADLNLIRYVFEKKLPLRIHVSGELGEWNRETMRLLLSFDNGGITKITRIIFHRKNTIADMKSCIHFAEGLGHHLEYEAFFLNENCHFTGGFCNSLHCDELAHLCHLDYRLSPPREAAFETWDTSFSEERIIGEGGCGFCAAKKLEEAGITHLKIVGRGASAEEIAEDVICGKRVLSLIKKCPEETSFPQLVKEEIFSGHCSNKCYYLE